ncbi:hypothetical protein MNBD_GAMMA11-2068 [hydrothermal vent metagenome]|uniref:Surface lipoprotein assembly modifier C-terminal domain-containing protein n=1 Tax=hydrothermal vent metagenome TaxID=652676 RepID=A0A3B0X9W3_9ZZZZ
MKNHVSLALKLFTLLISSLIFSAHADENTSEVTQSYSHEYLKQLFNSFRRQQAYAYASQFLGELEGNPEFDYIYGVAAIDTGHASKGVFALERVVLAFPSDHVSRLELARGYFILEEYPRAREEFETVLRISPPQQVKDTAMGYIDQISLREARYKTISSGFIEIAMGTDSNVNSGPENTDLLIVNLAPDSLGQDDVFTDFAAAWQITSPLSPGWLINSAITGAFRFNQELDEFNTATGTLQLGVARIFKHSRYKAGLIYQQFNLDGNDYRTLSGVNLEWNYSLNQKSRLISILQYARLDYATFAINNSNLITLSMGYNYAFNGPLSPLLFTSVNYSAESARETSQDARANTEREILGARAGTVLTLSSNLALQLSASYQNSQYAAAQTFGGFNNAIRDDAYTTADINLLWVFTRGWRLDTKFSYLDNRSNVEIYNYSRTMLSLSLNHSF